MNSKLAITLAAALAAVAASPAQESPVVVPLDPPVQPDNPPAEPTVPPTDPGDQPDQPDPATTVPTQPAFDITSTDSYHLDQTLSRASHLANQGELADSGGLLFQAAAGVEALSDPTRRDVSEAVAALRVLAFDIASHRTINPAQFRDAASSAHLSLATEQVLQCRGAWGERRLVAAGQTLQLASFHLDRAIAWSDRTPNAEGAAALATANQVGSALVVADPLQPVPPATVQLSVDQIAKMTATVGRSLVASRGKDGLDERITEASRTAIDGIKKGTRKAAEKIGDRLQRWGAALQAHDSPDR